MDQGNLVAIVDKEITSNDDVDLSLFDRNSQVVSGIPLRLLSSEMNRRQFKKGPAGILAVKSEQVRDRTIAKLGLSPEIVDVLLRGRLKLTYLIDSIGGWGLIADQAKDASDLVRENGGEVRAYGLNDLASTAAFMWDTADRRFVLNETFALWHIGDCTAQSGEADKIAEQKKRIVDRFKNAKPPYPDKIHTLVMSPDNPEGEVVLDGAKLAEMGIAELAFPTVKEAFAHFKASTGLRINAGMKHVNVCRFWFSRLLIEAIQH